VPSDDGDSAWDDISNINLFEYLIRLILMKVKIWHEKLSKIKEV
jgi:hypothetical protein